MHTTDKLFDELRLILHQLETQQLEFGRVGPQVKNSQSHALSLPKE